MKKNLRRIISVLMVVLIPLFLALMENTATGRPDNPLASLPFWLIWTITILLALGTLIWEFYDQFSSGELLAGSTPTEVQAATNRQHLLKQMHTLWIKSVLDQSWYKEIRLQSDLCHRPDALADPWHLSLLQDEQPASLLPKGTSILNLYEEAGGELLILGEAGAGKTTLLLELTRELLSRAEQDTLQPLPVVLNLSSWASKRQPFDEWVEEELQEKYRVSRPVAHMWVNQGSLLLLLDDLDRVATTHQAECLEALQTYRQQMNAVSVVVCCQTHTYFEQKHLVALSAAIEVQPLTEAYIHEVLAQAGGDFVPLQQALREDPTLTELATTPLWFHLLRHTFQNQPLSADLRSGTLEERRERLFTLYVERMLHRRKSLLYWRPEQAFKWLAVLAEKMRRESQPIFAVESLQLHWLPPTQGALMLCETSVLLFVFLFGSLSVLFVNWLITRQVDWVAAILFGMGIAMMVDRVAGIQSRAGTITDAPWSRVERFLPHHSGLIRGLVLGLIVGLVFGLITGLVDWLHGSELGSALVRDMMVGLVFVPVVGLPIWLSGEQRSGRRPLSPNEGIWLSGKNGLLIGLFVGLLTGLLTGPLTGLVSDRYLVMYFGVTLGLSCGFLFGLHAFVQHFTLRLFLWCSGWLPWNLVPFLDVI